MSNSEQNTIMTFDRAFETVISSACRLGSERVALAQALGRVLAEDVVSDIDMPPFDKSAMDGFACRRADLAESLAVIETIPAGCFPKNKIGPGRCAKIMTGSVVPEGADCVIMKEYVEQPAENVIRFVGENTRNNICIKGEDVKQGDIVLKAGCKVGPQHIAVLASVGCAEPLVSVQPAVGIIATGDELVEPSQKPAAGQIRNSNAYQLAAQVTGAAAVPTNYGTATDTKEATGAIVTKALAKNDCLLLSGGVSVGEYDIVKDVLKENGFELLFEKVAVKPGRPMTFGIKRITSHESRVTRYVFGLPGNPVSTFVMFELLVKPFLYKMMGHDFTPAVSHVPLAKTITRKKTERDFWLPVVFNKEGKAGKIEYHGSAHINALCHADGPICIASGVAEVKEGTYVVVRQIQ